jgi:hypothetical protein
VWGVYHFYLNKSFSRLKGGGVEKTLGLMGDMVVVARSLSG